MKCFLYCCRVLCWFHNPELCSQVPNWLCSVNECSAAVWGLRPMPEVLWVSLYCWMNDIAFLLHRLIHLCPVLSIFYFGTVEKEVAKSIELGLKVTMTRLKLDRNKFGAFSPQSPAKTRIDISIPIEVTNTKMRSTTQLSHALSSLWLCFVRSFTSFWANSPLKMKFPYVLRTGPELFIITHFSQTVFHCTVVLFISRFLVNDSNASKTPTSHWSFLFLLFLL